MKMRNVHELLTSKEEAGHEPGKPSSFQHSPDDGKIQLDFNRNLFNFLVLLMECCWINK